MHFFTLKLKQEKAKQEENVKRKNFTLYDGISNYCKAFEKHS